MSDGDQLKPTAQKTASAPDPAPVDAPDVPGAPAAPTPGFPAAGEPSLPEDARATPPTVPESLATPTPAPTGPTAPGPLPEERPAQTSGDLGLGGQAERDEAPGPSQAATASGAVPAADASATPLAPGPHTAAGTQGTARAGQGPGGVLRTDSLPRAFGQALAQAPTEPATHFHAANGDCGPSSADSRPRGRPRRRREAGASSVAADIHRVVKEQPGIHFRALARAAGLTSAGQLRHHLDRLARQGQLIELQDGGYKRFFATGEHEPSLRPGLARFSRSIPRRIGQLLLAGPLNRTELRRRLGCADSTLGYHLNRMLLQGDLKRRRGRSGCQYTLADDEFVRKVLVVHPGTLRVREETA